MAQWWEHSPPTNVARVQILASRLYVGWVCCWFSPLLREIFLWVLWFPLSSKTNISKFQFDHEWGRWRTPLWMCYLQIIIYLFIYYLFVNRWELRRLKNGEMDALQKHSKVLQLQSETLIDGYYTFLFFKSPSLWFKSILEFKKAFMKHFKIMACIYPATGNLTDNPELGTRWFPNSFQTCSNK